MVFREAVLEALLGWRGAGAETRVELLRSLCGGIRPRSFLTNAAALILLAALLLQEAGGLAPGVWLAALLVGGLLPRLYATYLCRRQDYSNPERKALGFVLISLIYGLTWGAGPWLLLPALDGLLLGVLLILMVFGAIMGPYASMPGLLWVRLLSTGVPTLLAAAVHGNGQLLFVCAVLGVWLGLRMDIWGAYHRSLREQIELRQALAHANWRKDMDNRKLRHWAETDALTGVGNRRLFMADLARLRVPAALIIFDIDHFKAINDQHGHTVGDELLKQLCQLVQSELRVGDVLTRIGGEEFAVVLHDISEHEALEVAERVRRRVSGHAFEGGSQPLGMTLSLGLAVIGEPRAEVDGTGLVAAADQALYAAKRAGRNTVRAAAVQASELPLGA
ncbi:GGDEF domain-containing protein [Alkalilimnicola sp. S0819]|uniref:GGDEF domain-containing protein n=1 Tax=Alkalilimnicola sp. S0819 TaxID=2613922 RepID=UPI0012627A29|nr:GGDEF domain-containing protein [Alkalilimnicola sp. S0819]KAB7623915.1 GGDEF domain-containing protein [Alkalilimnicola sp. S0819]MPQ16511.1 diguanylate cyclase [Alkalilimnicola sp. S0819]